jgi:hypothetical protein
MVRVDQIKSGSKGPVRGPPVFQVRDYAAVDLLVSIRDRVELSHLGIYSDTVMDKVC